MVLNDVCVGVCMVLGFVASLSFSRFCRRSVGAVKQMENHRHRKETEKGGTEQMGCVNEYHYLLFFLV